MGSKTPYELWNCCTPAFDHLRTFGCVAHVKVNTSHLKKLEDRSKPMIFVSYEPGSKAYRAYDPVARRVHVSVMSCSTRQPSGIGMANWAPLTTPTLSSSTPPCSSLAQCQ